MLADPVSHSQQFHTTSIWNRWGWCPWHSSYCTLRTWRRKEGFPQPSDGDAWSVKTTIEGRSAHPRMMRMKQRETLLTSATLVYVAHDLQLLKAFDLHLSWVYIRHTTPRTQPRITLSLPSFFLSLGRSFFLQLPWQKYGWRTLCRQKLHHFFFFFDVIGPTHVCGTGSYEHWKVQEKSH